MKEFDMQKTGLRILKSLALAAGVMLVLGGCDVNVWFGPIDDPPNQDDLTFTLTWNGDVDLDLYLTYPDPSADSVFSGSVPEYNDVENAYQPGFDGTPVGQLGFWPE
ncbi:MAG: hypothetical protein ACOC1I_08705, partial [Spirochaetota bacterium]